MKVLFFTMSSGRVPVLDFLKSLEARSRAEAFRVLEAVKKEGTAAAGVSCRQIKGKLWEIRVRSGGEVRIFYFIRGESPRSDDGKGSQGGNREREKGGQPEGEEMILLHAYLKKSKKAPTREIDTALTRMKELLI